MGDGPWREEDAHHATNGTHAGRPAVAGRQRVGSDEAEFQRRLEAQRRQEQLRPDAGAVSLTEKITHADPALKVQTAQSGDFGDFNSDFSFTTDGKECQNAMGDLFKMTSTVKWDGDILMFDSKMDFQGNAMSGVDKWSLSPDGKTLTVQRHFNGPMGEGDAVMVLDKQ